MYLSNVPGSTAFVFMNDNVEMFCVNATENQGFGLICTECTKDGSFFVEFQGYTDALTVLKAIVKHFQEKHVVKLIP